MTDPALLERLRNSARQGLTPAELHEQRLGWVRSVTGKTDDQLRELVPEMFNGERERAAVRTLEGLGYTHTGGEPLWRRPELGGSLTSPSL